MELQTYQHDFEELIQLEQEEEMKRHEQEMRQLSGPERERKGRCLTHMTIESTKTGIRGEQEVRFTKPGRDPLPDTDISVGDLVQLSRDEPLNSDNPTGTVWEKTSRSITISLPEQLPSWIRGDHLRIDMYVDNVTYQRMLDALFLLAGLTSEQEYLRDLLLEKQAPRPPGNVEGLDWVNPRLNEYQKQAVEKALGAPDVFLIHGPPGTGKTVSMTEVIAQAVKDGTSVLATAASNVAVDNLVSNLADAGVDVVRVGHPARATPTLRQHTLDYKLEDNETYQESQERRRRALELIEKRRSLTSPRGKYRRGLSNDEIHALARKNRGSRGVSPEKINEMSQYLELSDRIDELFEECDWLEEQAIEETLEGADVICSTNSTSGSDLLAGYRFDWVCIDEATQATEPSCLIPITKGRKVVMAGDHRQLPPTVLNKEAREQGLDYTLFERFMDRWGERCSHRLRIQYRMHHDIMSFSNYEFYGDELIADESVRDHTLLDIPDYTPGEVVSPFQTYLEPEPVLVWLDTAHLPAREVQREGSTSHRNPTEARIVTRLAHDFMKAGLEPSQVAIITPYKDQVERIRESFDLRELEINTVDGFQGREKEVILISFVRSNPEGDIGFLYDRRRLNVSLTRARRKLIMVGDSSTLGHDDLYQRLLQRVEQDGVHEPAPISEGALSSF